MHILYLIKTARTIRAIRHHMCVVGYICLQMHTYHTSATFHPTKCPAAMTQLTEKTKDKPVALILP